MSSTIDNVHYTLHLHRFALFLLPFSTIFWIWAIINTATKNYVDLGILSFLTVMLTSAYLLHIIRKGSVGIGSGSVFSILVLRGNIGFVTASHLLVIVNYALGASLTDHSWGRFYCIVFTGLWVCFAITFLWLVYMIRKGGDDGGGGDGTGIATAAGSTGVSGGADEEVVAEGEMA